MRKSLIIILLALGWAFSTEETPTEVYPALRPTVEQFIADAETYGIDTKTIKDSLDYIIPFPIDNNMYGVYTPYNRQISINVRNCDHPIILRAVMYHELAHVFGVRHSSGGIMDTGIAPLILVLRYADNQTWELHKKILFTEIKKLQDLK